MKPVLQKCTAALCAIACTCAALVLPVSAAATSQSDTLLENYSTQVLILLNEIRTEYNLVPFSRADCLDGAAAARANECLVSFSHVRPDGSQCFSILDEYGVDYMAAGENIAYGQTSAQHVVDSWMSSEMHRANILNPAYTYAGVGVAYDGTYAWSNLFTGGVNLSGTSAVNTTCITGDADYDGAVTTHDAYLTLMAYSRQSSGLDSSMNQEQTEACDINGNGGLDMQDAYCILTYASCRAAGNGRSWTQILAEVQ